MYIHIYIYNYLRIPEVKLYRQHVLFCSCWLWLPKEPPRMKVVLLLCTLHLLQCF